MIGPSAVAMAPDASWAVAVAGDGTVRTLGTGVAPRAVTIDVGQPAAVALSGERLRVLWAAERTIRLHESVEGARVRERYPLRMPVAAQHQAVGVAVAACRQLTPACAVDHDRGQLSSHAIPSPIPSPRHG